MTEAGAMATGGVVVVAAMAGEEGTTGEEAAVSSLLFVCSASNALACLRRQHCALRAWPHTRSNKMLH